MEDGFGNLPKRLKKALKGISGSLKDAWDWTVDAAEDAWDWTVDTAEDAWDWTVDTAEDAWNWTKDAAEDTWGLGKKTARWVKNFVAERFSTQTKAGNTLLFIGVVIQFGCGVYQLCAAVAAGATLGGPISVVVIATLSLAGSLLMILGEGE